MNSNDTHTEHPTSGRPVRYRKAKQAAADRQSGACRAARETTPKQGKKAPQPEAAA